jgi:hypothetical protein
MFRCFGVPWVALATGFYLLIAGIEYITRASIPSEFWQVHLQAAATIFLTNCVVAVAYYFDVSRREKKRRGFDVITQAGETRTSSARPTIRNGRK